VREHNLYVVRTLQRLHHLNTKSQGLGKAGQGVSWPL